MQMFLFEVFGYWIYSFFIFVIVVKVEKYSIAAVIWWNAVFTSIDLILCYGSVI